MSDAEFYNNFTIRSIAARHWRTIDSCDVLILVANGEDKTFTGANVEVGYAIARNKPVLSMGGIKRSAMYVPLIQCDDIVDLIDALDIIGGRPR